MCVAGRRALAHSRHTGRRATPPSAPLSHWGPTAGLICRIVLFFLFIKPNGILIKLLNALIILSKFYWSAKRCLCECYDITFRLILIHVLLKIVIPFIPVNILLALGKMWAGVFVSSADWVLENNRSGRQPNCIMNKLTRFFTARESYTPDRHCQLPHE